jgi:hypothetical protein
METLKINKKKWVNNLQECETNRKGNWRADAWQVRGKREYILNWNIKSDGKR